MDPKQIGKRIKEARTKYGLTQEDVLERWGKKHPSELSAYENGRKISANDLYEIAQAIGVPVGYFFQDSLTADEDLETLLLQWFRELPTLEAKRRTFSYLEQMKPLIIGEDKPITYKPKSKRKG